MSEDEGFSFKAKEDHSHEFMEKSWSNTCKKRDEVEYDISNLIDLLNEVSFPDGNSNSKIQKSDTESDNFSSKSSNMFQFLLTSNNKYETEIKEQQHYFKDSKILIISPQCKEDCLIHDQFNLRATILNELLLTFSNLVEYEEGYNEFADFTLIPDETTLKI